MRKIYGIGEALLDIIFKECQPQVAKAGGSVLNSLVSMGRCGLPVSFISEYGADQAGKIIDDFLRNNGVDTSFVDRYSNGSTALALAFLDEKNDAKYDFYKDYPADRLNIKFPGLNKDDIFQCGSFYTIWPEIRAKFKKFLDDSYKAGALILYDPNFRESHDINSLRKLVIENMEKASLIRGSNEDFRNIFGVNDPDKAWEEVRKYCKCLVYTASVEGVYVRTTSFSGKFPVQKITPVSTIGAGDNFNAGMLTAIYTMNIKKDDLEHLGKTEWEKITGTAVEFATHVCMSYENYISDDFAVNYR